MAVVARPEEIDRLLVNKLHRITRQFDDDPYGDCIWGLITGLTPEDAERMADTSGKPLVLKRALGTTNFDHNRFEQSFMVTDWEPNQYWEQKKHGQTQGPQFAQESPQGMAFMFNEKWQEINPQMVVTSSHATQYNLEMPFGKGLIASMDGRFHILRQDQKKDFAQFIKGARFDGSEKDLKKYIEQSNAPLMPVSDEARVWIACGNCLFGDANNSANSMVVTAISAVGCRQVIGYTVPTWFGVGGWGTLKRFFDNTQGMTLAEAWYLNNQMVIDDTIQHYPDLLEVEFNGVEMNSQREDNKDFTEAIEKKGYTGNWDAIGHVHDRDVVAFYGNPLYAVIFDETAPSKSPWMTSGSFIRSAQGEVLEIEAFKDHKGPFAFFHPLRLPKSTPPLHMEYRGQTFPMDRVGVETNDFIIIRELDLKKGEKVRLIRKEIHDEAA